MLKSITSILYFEWISCSCAWFGNIILWSFGSSVPNTGTLGYSDLQNVGIFHYRGSKKITFVNVTTDFLRKVLNREVIEIDTSFPKFKFPLESVDVNIGNKCCQLFSVKWEAPFVHFQETSLPDTQVWITIVGELFFHVKMAFHEKSD